MVAIADIDNFKLVNDSAGHPVGDAVLRDIANLLATRLRPQDVCARLSGDEFALLLPGCTTDEGFQIVERLLDAVRGYRLPIDDGSIDITISVGLAPIQPDDDSGRSAENALLHADSALYEAKGQGRNRAVIWTPTLAQAQQLASRRGWSTRIKDALAEDRFIIHLQPIVDLDTGLPVYHEALTRMLDPHDNLLSPAVFLPHAHELGLMEAIDRNALDQAVALLEADPELRIFINLDPASFYSDNLLDRLETILLTRPHLHGRLGIEITERAPIRDYQRAQQRLHALKSHRLPHRDRRLRQRLLLLRAPPTPPSRPRQNRQRLHRPPRHRPRQRRHPRRSHHHRPRPLHADRRRRNRNTNNRRTTQDTRHRIRTGIPLRPPQPSQPRARRQPSRMNQPFNFNVRLRRPCQPRYPQNPKVSSELEL